MPPFLESRVETLDVRGLRYNVRHWGAPDAPQLFLLHGWMDSSVTFQFVVDALSEPWHVIAPDWRGYGGSEWLGRPYWFPDYYADLDCLLQHYSPQQPARLVGHSMGANIASIYAAARPQRVAQLAMLDFLGLPASAASAAPTHLARWLDAQSQTPALRAYADHAALARRLRSVNPRLTVQRADFLAEHGSRRLADGRVELACDPWHKVAAPTLYRIDEALACWRSVASPLLLLIAEQGFVHERFGDDPDEYARRIGCFADADVVTIADCGHNLQHDQPERVARVLEGFLQRAE
ncbi:MAG: alpha/beta hydrolase [Rhodocyclaceae bacterium]